MRLSARSIGAALLAPLRRGWRRWGQSMSTSVVTSTLMVSIGTVALVGACVTTEVKDGLVDNRIDRVLVESARDAATAQDRADNFTSANAQDLQGFVYDLWIELRALGGESS